MWRQPLGCEAGDPGVSCGRNNGVIESCHFEANSQNLGRTGSCAGNYCYIAIEPLKYSKGFEKNSTIFLASPYHQFSHICIIMHNTCFVLDKPASEFSLTLYYTCNGGVDESTFSNDTSNNIIFSSGKYKNILIIYFTR